MNKQLLILKILLLLCIAEIIRANFYPYFLILMGKESYNFITPLDLFFQRDRFADNITHPMSAPFIFKFLKHPFEHLQHLFSYLLIILTCIGIFRFFRSKYRQTTILIFVLMTYAWLNCIFIIDLLIRYSFWTTPSILNAGSGNYLLNILIMLAKVILYLLMIRLTKNIAPPESTPETIEKPPIKWMRGFGNMGDRIIVLMQFSYLFMLYFLVTRSSDLFNDSILKDREATLANIKFSMMFGLESILLIVLLLSEGLFGFTPFKIISGTRVTPTNGGKTSFGQVLIRTLARLIPFDAFSFIFGKGWHDSISKTQVVYTKNEHWLVRHSRIGTWMISIYLVLFAWILIHGTAVFADHDRYHYDSEIFQLIISTCFSFIFLCSFISMWIASTANYAYNLKTDASESGLFFWKSICIWIPIVNLITLGDLLRLIYAHLETDYPDNIHLKKLRKRSNVFAGLFLLSYYLFSWMAYYFFTGTRMDFQVACMFTSFGFLVCLIPLLRYIIQVKKVALEIAIQQLSTQDAGTLAPFTEDQ
jgi:hypothetical protein